MATMELKELKCPDMRGYCHQQQPRGQEIPKTHKNKQITDPKENRHAHMQKDAIVTKKCGTRR